MAPAHPSPFERGRFPVWTSLSAGNLCYGFPCLREGYVKVAEDSKVGDTTVDVWRQPTRAFLAWTREVVADRIPSLDGAAPFTTPMKKEDTRW